LAVKTLAQDRCRIGVRLAIIAQSREEQQLRMTPHHEILVNAKDKKECPVFCLHSSSLPLSSSLNEPHHPLRWRWIFILAVEPLAHAVHLAALQALVELAALAEGAYDHIGGDGKSRAGVPWCSARRRGSSVRCIAECLTRTTGPLTFS